MLAPIRQGADPWNKKGSVFTCLSAEIFAALMRYQTENSALARNLP
jgi:hypothetical protein